MSNLSKTFLKTNNSIPIWLMRQAGRFLPEYRKVRESTTNFLDLCYNSNLAFEVSMQPMDRFNFDAAILFSDILVVPDAMGYDVNFIKGRGPVLKKITLEDIDKLCIDNFDNMLEYLTPSYSTIQKLKNSLSKEKSIIGFCGAPWTVATYMVNGGSSRDHSETRFFAYKEKDKFLKLLDYLAHFSALYLIEQIKAGANIVQIFDSWAGVLSYEEFVNYCIKPIKKMVSIIKEQFPNVLIIGFPKGANSFLAEFVKETNVSALSVDSRVTYNEINKLQENVVVQGNLDPLILLLGGKLLEKKIDEILSNLGNKNFIFNLGHGILPNTPPENVELLVKKVKAYDS